MHKLNTFFRSVWLSITSPKYYLDVLKTNVDFSFKYLVIFQIFFSLLTSTMILVPLAHFDTQKTLTDIQAEIPTDLVLSFENGELAINRPLPYRFPERPFSGSDDFQYFIVFDSDENIQGAADVFAHQSLAVVTESTAYVRDSNQKKLETYSFSEFKDSGKDAGSVSSKQVIDFIDQVKTHPFIAQKLYVPVAAVILFFVVLPLSVLLAVISAAIYGFFVWIMVKLLQNQLMAGHVLSYSKAVQVTIHSSTLLILIQLVLNWVAPGHPFNGVLYLIAFLAWTGFLLSMAHQDTQKNPPKVATESSTKRIERSKEPI